MAVIYCKHHGSEPRISHCDRAAVAEPSSPLLTLDLESDSKDTCRMRKDETQVSGLFLACCERTRSPGYTQENKTHHRCLLVTKEKEQCKQAKQRSLGWGETLL